MKLKSGKKGLNMSMVYTYGIDFLLFHYIEENLLWLPAPLSFFHHGQNYHMLSKKQFIITRVVSHKIFTFVSTYVQTKQINIPCQKPKKEKNIHYFNQHFYH